MFAAFGQDHTAAIGFLRGRRSGLHAWRFAKKRQCDSIQNRRLSASGGADNREDAAFNIVAICEIDLIAAGERIDIFNSEFQEPHGRSPLHRFRCLDERLGRPDPTQFLRGGRLPHA